MKRGIIFGAFVGLIVVAVYFFGFTDKSEGFKAGLLQKVSHKSFPCDYYSAQIAFQGGMPVSGNDGSPAPFGNAQDFTISKEAFDTLQTHVGEHVQFHYKDRRMKFCEESKLITSLKTFVPHY